jgi:activator of 2-hydroxyglutaryl-CoA dehydratase
VRVTGELSHDILAALLGIVAAFVTALGSYILSRFREAEKEAALAKARAEEAAAERREEVLATRERMAEIARRLEEAQDRRREEHQDLKQMLQVLLSIDRGGA